MWQLCFLWISFFFLELVINFPPCFFTLLPCSLSVPHLLGGQSHERPGLSKVSPRSVFVIWSRPLTSSLGSPLPSSSQQDQTLFSGWPATGTWALTQQLTRALWGSLAKNASAPFPWKLVKGAAQAGDSNWTTRLVPHAWCQKGSVSSERPAKGCGAWSVLGVTAVIHFHPHRPDHYLFPFHDLIPHCLEKFPSPFPFGSDGAPSYTASLLLAPVWGCDQRPSQPAVLTPPSWPWGRGSTWSVWSASHPDLAASGIRDRYSISSLQPLALSFSLVSVLLLLLLSF